MIKPKNKFFEVTSLLPGRTSPFFRRNFLSDILFFLAVVSLPSSFFAFIPQELFFDVRLLYLIIGFLYGVFYIKNLKKIKQLPGGKLLIIVVVFLVFELLFSLFVHEIPFIEVIAIFRTNFSYPITTLGFLLYAASMDYLRLNRFFYWLLYLTLVLGFIYILSNFSGINFYAVISKEEYENFKGKILLQNLSAVPTYINILFAIGLLYSNIFKKVKYHFFWIIPLVVTLIIIVRSQVIVYLIIFVLFLFLGIRYIKSVKLNQLAKIIMLLPIIILILSLVFSSHISRMIEKFGIEETSKIETTSHLEEGTYSLRLGLIEEAYERTKVKGNLLFGNGYQRENEKGEYDFVIGGDTLIAPVLYTEGFIGLLLRFIPVLYFLIFGLKNIKTKHSILSYFSLLFIVLIIPELFNIIQTSIFVLYTEKLFIFYLLLLFYHKQKKELSKIIIKA